MEEQGESRGEERKSFFQSQLSIRRERKFDMVDLNTFSIISKQEVSPAAVFSFLFVEEGASLPPL